MNMYIKYDYHIPWTKPKSYQVMAKRTFRKIYLNNLFLWQHISPVCIILLMVFTEKSFDYNTIVGLKSFSSTVVVLLTTNKFYLLIYGYYNKKRVSRLRWLVVWNCVICVQRSGSTKVQQLFTDEDGGFAERIRLMNSCR